MTIRNISLNILHGRSHLLQFVIFLIYLWNLITIYLASSWVVNEGWSFFRLFYLSVCLSETHEIWNVLPTQHSCILANGSSLDQYQCQWQISMLHNSLQCLLCDRDHIQKQLVLMKLSIALFSAHDTCFNCIFCIS